MYKYLIPVCFLFTSCMAVEPVIEGSYDINQEREEGASALSNSSDVGFNLIMEMGFGMNQVKRGVLSVGDRDWLPYGYEPVKSDNYWTVDGSLELVRKGSKFDQNHTHLTYFNVLGDATWRHPLEGGGSLYAGGGLYIGYGLGGSVSGSGFSEAAFGGDGGYKRFDAGLHAKAGYDFASSLRVGLAYEYGLVNKSSAPDFTSRNSSFSLNVGYSLDKIIHGFKRSK